MTFPLAYCPHGTEVLSRLRRLYDERAQDIVLASMHVPSPALERFESDRQPGPCEYPNPWERARFWDALLQEHAPIHDDSIPRAYLTEFDQGLYGGLLGGDVRFLCFPETGWISSMVAPLLHDWAEFENLSFGTDHPWFQRYVRQLEIFVQAAQGRFAISNLIAINGLNFVYELVGATRTYLELSDQPEMVRRAIELGLRLNCLVHSTFFEHVPLLEGGTCSYNESWIPGRIVCESVDPFHMTSVAYFERWGREPLERLIAHFDGGTTHIHANGRHLLEPVASVKGLKALYVGDEPGFRPPFEVLDEIKRCVGDLPLIVPVSFCDFCRAVLEHRLIGGVYYKVLDVPDVDSANCCMDLVREYDI